MANGMDGLYELLPAFYRDRDAQQNYPLRALLRILSQQAVLVDADIEQLYENLFIETCDRWVVPYIGDLVGNNLLYDAGRMVPTDTAKSLFQDLAGKDLLPAVAIRVRADVAKTIYYRRRKSTPKMLEELARDVTGRPCRVVEFFQALGWTQHMEHLRPQCGTADLRSMDRMERTFGPFDETSHAVDVRQPSRQEGWYNVRNVGFFLWRLQSFPLDRVPARRAGSPWQYHFSPLGNPAPLFSRLRPETEDGSLVTEADISAPIRNTLFYQGLRDYAASAPPRPEHTGFYGPFDVSASDPTVSTGTSLHVVLNGNGIDPGRDAAAPPASFVPQIVCMKLMPWPSSQPAGKIVGVDVVNGRLAVGDGWGVTGPVDVSYCYGFSAGLGGGTYDRRKWLIRRDLQPAPKIYTVQDSTTTPVSTKLIDAIQQWEADGRPDAVITILDSRTYSFPDGIALRNEGWLAIEAADRERPLLQTADTGFGIAVSDPASAGDPDRNASFTLSGVAVEGFLHVTGDLGRLRLFHSTLIPGRRLGEDGHAATNDAGLIVEGKNGTGETINSQLRIESAFSIFGQFIVPEQSYGIWVLDSIMQGIGGTAICDASGKHGAPLYTERSTFLGAVLVKSLEASESIFTAAVDAERTQEGCVRFSFLAQGSRTPRRFRCQPDLAVTNAIDAALQNNPVLSPAEKLQITGDVLARLVPSFTTALYGRPAYAQLHASCPVEIRTGAEDGSEMGAFCYLKQPQRESNLRIRLREYLPFGLDAAIITIT